MLRTVYVTLTVHGSVDVSVDDDNPAVTFSAVRAAVAHGPDEIDSVELLDWSTDDGDDD